MTTRRTRIESQDVELPPNQEIDLAYKEGDEESEIQLATAHSIMDDRTKALLAEEKKMRAFMEEKLTFSIAETDDPNAPNPVTCGVNGVTKTFKRGQIYTEARKFVDSLIKVSRRVKTVNYKDNDGIYQTKIETTPSMVYPIQIIEDPSGMGPQDMGRKWFIHQQRNAF